MMEFSYAKLIINTLPTWITPRRLSYCSVIDYMNYENGFMMFYFELQEIVGCLDLRAAHGYVCEDVHDGFPEQPGGVRVIAGDHLHADAEVAVAAEEVDCTTDTELSADGVGQQNQQTE